MHGDLVEKTRVSLHPAGLWPGCDTIAVFSDTKMSHSLPDCHSAVVLTIILAIVLRATEPSL